MIAKKYVSALVAALLFVPLAHGAVNPGEEGDQSLTSLSMEELTNLTVSSVSRRDQQLSRVAAAVYIITEDEIRRSGLTSIPELLRRVPGITVARIDSNKWAVSSRGFNSRFANKMLVLIDGRSVYNNEYSGVYWDQNDVLMEDIERIEVIRGPGATMWGANAVNGVINIITKKAKSTRGGMLTTRAGGDEVGSAAFRYGGGDGQRLNYRGFAKYFDRRALLSGNGSLANDAWHSARAGGRLDWEATGRDTFSFSGDAYRGRSSGTINQTFQTPFATLVHDTPRFSGGFAMGRWEHTLRGSDIALQTYYNDERRTEWFAGATLRTIDVDFQQHMNLRDRHDIVWGAGYRWMRDNLLGPNPVLDPRSRNDQLVSAFFQDDLTIVPDRFVVTVGSKILHNSYTGIEVQPGIRLLWTPNRRHSLWTSVARAVRTPSRRDEDLNLSQAIPSEGPLPVRILMLGNRSFKSETMIAYEGGYRSQVTRRVSLDIAAFMNDYNNLEMATQLTPYVKFSTQPYLALPITFVNAGYGRTYGVESSLSWSVNRRWRLQAGHAWMMAHLNGPLVPQGISYQSFAWMTPKNTFSFHSGFDLTRRLSLDGSVYYVSRMPERNIGSYARTDLRIAWKFGESTELSAGVQNLGADRHQEFSLEEYSLPSVVRRSAYIQATWRF